MENMSVFSSYYLSQSPFNITLGMMYLLNIMVGIIGNFLVAFIVYKNRDMHTTTNYLLSNLAVADLVSLFFCPIPLVVDVTNSHVSGNAGQFVCKVFTGSFLSQIAKCAAFTTLIFLATERYYAIASPFETRFILRKDNVSFAIGLSWVLGVTISIPFVVFSEFNEESKRCFHPWTIEKASSMRAYIITVAVAFVGVTCLLVYCYAQILRGIYVTRTVCSESVAASTQTQLKAKRKLAMTSVMVTVSFCICYSPSVFFQLYLAFAETEKMTVNYGTLYIVQSIFRFILYFGSSSNPLIYAFQSSSYRENLKQICTIKRNQRVGVSAVCELELQNG